MKLYLSPSACSLSPHIVAHEAGIPVTLVKVDIRTYKTADGTDFSSINPKGYVPALELDDGEILTEGPTIVQYLADMKPEAKLLPPAGTFGRVRVEEMLGYINSEIHKGYGPLFSDKTAPEVREERTQYLKKRYALVDKALSGKDYLFGTQFTVADAYLYTVTRWAAMVKLGLSDFPHLLAFQERTAQRPAVVAALAAEQALKRP